MKQTFKNYFFPAITMLLIGSIAGASLTVDPVKEGVALASLQTAGNTTLTTIATNTTGLATATAQTTGNGTLASILSGMTTATLQAITNSSLATIVTNTTALAPVSTAVLTQPANAITSFSIVGANASRHGLVLYNNSTTNCAVAFGATATMVAFTVMLQAGTHYEMPLPIYQGAVSGICTAANGATNSTEY